MVSKKVKVRPFDTSELVVYSVMKGDEALAVGLYGSIEPALTNTRIKLPLPRGANEAHKSRVHLLVCALDEIVLQMKTKETCLPTQWHYPRLLPKSLHDSMSTRKSVISLERLPATLVMASYISSWFNLFSSNMICFYLQMVSSSLMIHTICIIYWCYFNSFKLKKKSLVQADTFYKKMKCRHAGKIQAYRKLILSYPHGQFWGLRNDCAYACMPVIL